MDYTQAALSNSGLLNKQFGDAFSPISNFSSANVQLGVQEQQRRQQQIDQMARLQFEADAARQRQEDALRAHDSLTRWQGQQHHSDALEVAKLQISAQTDAKIKEQADKIRSDTRARRIVGPAIAGEQDTPEGNRRLVATYTAAFANPEVGENLDTEDAVTLTKQIKQALSQITDVATNTPQAKAAVQKFLADPSVATILAKKGQLTATQIESLKTGDPAKIGKIIDEVASRSALLWGQDRNVLAQLTTAWNEALVSAGATPSPTTLVNVDYLQSLMKARDQLLPNIRSEDSWKRISEAQGFGPQVAAKLPPPTAANAAPQRTFIDPKATEVNPFGAPPVVQAPEKVGPAATIQNLFQGASGAEVNSRVLTRDDNVRGRELAFYPDRLGQNPSEEYAVRKQALDRMRLGEAFTSGLSTSIPFIPNYEPKYGAHDQIRDEIALQGLVQQMYLPQQAPGPETFIHPAPYSPISPAPR